MKPLTELIKLIPIRTLLVYFIIASLLIIAFKVPIKSAEPVTVGGTSGAASIEVLKPIPKVCNESQTKTQKCGTGLCASVLTITCINDSWVYEACPGNIYARKEVCNGVDDDCDGYADNNLEPQHCELTLGVCNGSYYKKCAGASGWQQCGDGDYNHLLYEPSERTCFDGYDNDCDGAVDYWDKDCVNRDSNR